MKEAEWEKILKNCGDLCVCAKQLLNSLRETVIELYYSISSYSYLLLCFFFFFLFKIWSFFYPLYFLITFFFLLIRCFLLFFLSIQLILLYHIHSLILLISYIWLLSQHFHKFITEENELGFIIGCETVRIILNSQHLTNSFE